MIQPASEAEFGFYVIAVVFALIPLTIWALADLDRRVEARLAAQRRRSR